MASQKSGSKPGSSVSTVVSPLHVSGFNERLGLGLSWARLIAVYLTKPEATREKSADDKRIYPKLSSFIGKTLSLGAEVAYEMRTEPRFVRDDYGLRRVA